MKPQRTAFMHVGKHDMLLLKPKSYVHWKLQLKFVINIKAQEPNFSKLYFVF